LTCDSIDRTENLINFFSALPSDGQRDFELSLTGLVKRFSDRNDLDDKLKAVLNGGSNVNIRYAAFYALAILHRYNKEYPKMQSLVYSHESEFGGMDTYSHLRLLYALSAEEQLTFNHIETAYENSQKLSDNAGIVHLFADLTATFCEKEFDNERQEIGEYIKKALAAVDKTIKMDPDYAKYYCTRSRLLFLNDNLIPALRNIDKAISMESPKSSNYTMNICLYQNHKIKIVFEIENRNIDEKTNKLTKEIKKIKKNLVKSIEIIGFFSGVIALVIGSLQMAASSPEDAIKLILTLFGSLLSAFAAFGIILHGFDKDRTPSNLFVMIFGLLVIGGVLLFL